MKSTIALSKAVSASSLEFLFEPFRGSLSYSWEFVIGFLDRTVEFKFTPAPVLPMCSGRFIVSTVWASKLLDDTVDITMLSVRVSAS